MLYITLCIYLDKSLEAWYTTQEKEDSHGSIFYCPPSPNCGWKYKRVDGYKQRRGGEKTWIDFEIRSCPCTHSWIARNISETSWTALTVPFPGQKQAAYWSFKFRITGSEMETCMPLKTAFLLHFSLRDRFSSIPLCPPFEPKPSFASRDIQINDPNRGEGSG